VARLARLVVPGQAHLLIQRGVGGHQVFVDLQDRRAYIGALRFAAAAEGVQIHAYALLDTEVRLLATPAEAAALGRMVQALGRTYVSAYNRRHGRSGTLWDGRFRCAVVEPGSTRLAALLWVDGATTEVGAGSAAHRTGRAPDPTLVDLPEFWQLGNTPFEREAAYQGRLDAGMAMSMAESLRHAAMGGWAAGSASFAASLTAEASRPALPRARGRPRRPGG
jgi:putative transposase